MSAQLVEQQPNYFVFEPTHPSSQLIAKALTWYSPKFSPKDVPRFYDISGITEDPAAFRLLMDLLTAHFNGLSAEQRPTKVLGYDARGFVVGAPLAVSMGVPFVMLRKEGKAPGALVESDPYHKEYTETSPDTMAIRAGSVVPGDRVLLIDDLIATGGTALAGFQLVEGVGAHVAAFLAVVIIPQLNGVEKIHAYQNGMFKHVPVICCVDHKEIPDSACRDPTAEEWPFPTRAIGFAESALIHKNK